MPKSSKYYDVLGLQPDATGADIRIAYKNLARKYHPDRNKSPDATEKFKALGEAYEVLGDEGKRRLYDQYGEDGLQQNGDPFSAARAESVFSHVFGGFGGFREEQPTRTQDLMHALQVSLEDLYKGKTKKMMITRQLLCEHCQGRGGRDGKAPTQCAKCRGNGTMFVTCQLAPGMVTRMQTTCDSCRGEGSTLADKDRCQGCGGQKTVSTRQAMEVHIDPGMRHGQKIVKAGMADEAPGLQAGDVVFVVQEMEHPEFKRQGDDLYISRQISLVEALTGFRLFVTHLDGRVLQIQSRPGEVIKPGEVKGIAREGMPINGNQHVRGSLFVQFEVVFPESGSLGSDQCEMLRQSLPSPLPQQEPMSTDASEPEECFLTVGPGQTSDRGGDRARAEEESRPQVQCAQQ